MDICYYRAEKHPLEFIHINGRCIKYPLHNHASVFTAGFIISGNVEVQKGEEITTLSSGSSFVIPPYMPHTLISKGMCHMLSICIHKSFIAGHSPAEVKTILKSYLAHIPCQTPDIDTLLFERTPDCASVNTAKNLIETHPEAENKLEQLAEQSAVSKYHMIKKFKKATGLTPHRFQIQNRVRLAQRLLQENHSLTEAALEAGFYDQSHFIRHFKNLVRLTPKEYKASCVKII